MLNNALHLIKKLRYIYLLMVLFAMPITSFAQNVTLIYDDNSLYQTNFVNSLSAQLLSNTHVNLTTITTTSLSIETLKKAPSDIIVNVNNDTIKKLIASNIPTTTFHALTTLSRSIGFAPCLPDCKKKLPQHHFFVLDQPPARQLNLIQLINPMFKEVGIVVTEQSKNQLTQLKEIAARKKLTINEHISSSKNVRYQIDNISKSSDIILAIADTDIYNATSLSQILLTSYRYRTPIIGFSKGFIRAGAIAGAVSSIEQLAQHLAESISTFNNTSEPLSNNVIYPKYFNVVSNRSVAKSLNLHLPNDNKLKEKLITYESTR
ncbi:MAG: ABC transporter substrate-binding protein [Cycloclasticus sp.]|jgi:putative ABC transport system substrate-binding protein|nr:ABC transporter substrate-binding protein [Cycloclasticus sp.]